MNGLINNFHSKYIFATCEPFNIYKHGYDNNSTTSVKEYHIVIDTHTTFHDFSSAVFFLRKRHERHFRLLGKTYNNTKIHLIAPIILPGGEFVAIIKTMWISILQRTWRRIYYERKRKITKYLQLKNLQKREIGIN